MAAPQVVTTVSATYDRLDVDAFCAFARELVEMSVRGTAPITVRQHESQRGDAQGVTFTATVHG